MEAVNKIRDFVSTCDGYGCGYGSGSGFDYGSGYGYGSCIGDGGGEGSGFGYSRGNGGGYGNGSGFGDGRCNGYGSGSCDGDCDGIKAINGFPVYMVDDVPTIINRIHGSVAKGAILKSDLTLEKCYVVKQGNTFAHGQTLREAMSALTDKLFEDMPEEERIAEFIKSHKWGKKYPSADYYEWHHKLTGSCDMGRSEFAESHGYKLTDDELLTVDEFIKLTENSYGSSTIRKLKAEYERLRGVQEVDDG